MQLFYVNSKIDIFRRKFPTIEFHGHGQLLFLYSDFFLFLQVFSNNIIIFILAQFYLPLNNTDISTKKVVKMKKI